jgi:DNA-binding response OmpR family regulator
MARFLLSQWREKCLSLQLKINMEKVLIVEDDQTIAKALAFRLKSAGYEVTVTHDAVAGVAAAREFQPDLAVLDISIPAGDGFSVAERVRELIVTATPIIFLTASKQSGLRQKAQQFGAAFFEKPYDADDLLAAIRYALLERSGRRVRGLHDATVSRLS